MHLGVVGLGGLGHVAVKFAKAMGSKVTVISTSPSKRKEAMEKLGADEFLVSHDHEQLQVSNHIRVLKYICIYIHLYKMNLIAFPKSKQLIVTFFFFFF